MGQGYFRNVDDGYSDPELIAAAYLVGKSAYFEVELTLSEFNDRIIANSGGLAGSPNLIAATASGPGGSGIGCPEENQWVWVESSLGVNHIKAKSLLDLEGDIRLYNPMTRRFNVLTRARALKNVELYETRTRFGVEGITSLSHKLIQNAGDLIGKSLSNFVVGNEALRVENATKNIFLDQVVEISFIGVGTVIEISLKSEFIYASGSRKAHALLGHNQKQVNPDVLS